ncbi:hypothetical protein VPH35_044543 [Triticum aestivum]
MWLEIQPGKRERAAAGVHAAAQREHKPSWLWHPTSGRIVHLRLLWRRGQRRGGRPASPYPWRMSSGPPQRSLQQARGASSVGSRRSTSVGSTVASPRSRASTSSTRRPPARTTRSPLRSSSTR